MSPQSKPEIEIAWAAGFFDGEGCTFCAKHHSGSRSLQMTVAQTQRENLVRLQAALQNLGNITGPIILDNRKPIYTWRACGPVAQDCINLLRPYLCKEKSEQASSALLAWSFRGVNTTIGICGRGHDFNIVGRYRARSGRTECNECRLLRRRKGVLPPRMVISAIEARLGMREYIP